MRIWDARVYGYIDRLRSVSSRGGSIGKQVGGYGVRIRGNGFWVPLLCMSGLGACAVGPDYKKPHTWTPSAWQHEQSRVSAPESVTTSDRPDSAWWKIFHDRELSDLETRLAAQNIDVQVAMAQLARSRAQLMIAGAERYPGLSASGSYARSQYSTKTMQRIISRVGKGSNLLPGENLADMSGSAVIPLLDQWRDSIDATWEVDLWGRVRRQYEASKAYMDQTGEQARSVLIARQADLARDYAELRGLQEQLRILQKSQNEAKQMLDLSSARYHAGLVSELDVQNARGQLETATAQIPQMEQGIRERLNAISLLMGAVPHSLDRELEPAGQILPVPPKVPVGVPSELAQRRPDIRSAEAGLHAATAEVGEAMADFYPKVTIDAGFGFQSLSFRDLGFWNARAWNVGPSITLPIFQGGRLRGQLELKKAAQKEAALEYRQTVLGAWKEVDDALTASADEQARRDQLAERVKTSERAWILAGEQYRHGMTTFLQVLNAERQLLSARQDFAESQTSVATNVVRLYNALGGGWETVM